MKNKSTSQGKLDYIGELLLNWRIRTVLPQIQGRLLDVGCGTNKLVKTYGNGIGIDVHQFGGADLILSDTSKTPFSDNEFNTITIIATLNHVPNRKEMLKEMNRILKDNGRLIITMITPFISKLWHKIRASRDRDQLERGIQQGEVYGLTRKEVKKLLEETNFKIIYEKTFMLGLNRLTIVNKAS